MELKPNSRAAFHLHMDKTTKDGLAKIAAYRHSTLANLIEEGARMVIHRETTRIREDLTNLQKVSSFLRT